ncbi:hypothetical protein [Rhodoligotrophos ferricapiens]|uniref:hypothetical protein n=1 Tax=Rhodoligotrophos ferricapiens TaxID=3069264 RepID=UPI00315D629A
MTDQREVVVTDIRMPFWSMVRFLVKLAIASIPAFVILWLVSMLLLLLFGVTSFAWIPFTFHWGTGSVGPGIGA